MYVSSRFEDGLVERGHTLSTTISSEPAKMFLQSEFWLLRYFIFLLSFRLSLVMSCFFLSLFSLFRFEFK